MRVTGTLGDNQPGAGVHAGLQVLTMSGSELDYSGAQYGSAGAVADTLTTRFTLVGLVDRGDRWESSFDLKAWMRSNHMGAGSFADFGNSAYLALSLPAGVSFGSDSGVFLTTAVPEPTTWALWLAGLAGLAGLALVRGRRT